MSKRVLVPWPDIAAYAEHNKLPDTLDIDIYDGTSPPPSRLDNIEFYVLPYDKGPEPPQLIPRMPALRAVQSLSAGVDALLPLIPPNIQLANARGIHDASVAEHALSLILAAQRDLPRWFRQQQTHTWLREHTRSLAKSRVMILGYGSIGQAIARWLHAADATVIPVASRPRPAEGVRGIDDLSALLPNTDILVMVLPSTPQTRHLIGAPELAALPDEALVVNVGRGSTMDTAALTAETATGRLRAALDVVDPEPLPSGHPLWTHENVLLTPHIAGGSASFYPEVKRLIATQLHRFAAGEPLLNLV